MLFKNLIASTTLSTKLVKISQTEDRVPEADVASELLVIDRRLNYLTKYPVLDAYRSGKINLVVNKEQTVPNYLAVLPYQDHKKVTRTMVNLTSYTNKSGSINSNAQFFALMQNGVITQALATNWGRFTHNTELMRTSALVYSRLVNRVLDKLYSNNIDDMESDFTGFLFAKFFLLGIAGKAEGDLIDSLAYKAAFNKTSFQLIKERENEIGGEDLIYTDIFTLFTQLNTSEKHRIKIRTFIENFVRMYGESTILAIDYLPSFYHAIFSSQVNGNLAKDYIIENTSPDITSCYVAFSKLL